MHACMIIETIDTTALLHNTQHLGQIIGSLINIQEKMLS